VYSGKLLMMGRGTVQNIPKIKNVGKIVHLVGSVISKIMKLSQNCLECSC
jgi:hypothetical protein